jgi:hypothetical protein
MSERYDAHSLSLTDIPHILRLRGEGIVLDSGLRCTTTSATSGTWLSSMMPHTSRHTLVARYGGQRVVGQFYISQDGHSAQLVYLAPRLPAEGEDSAWLLVLDAMVREAGRRGARTLIAELDEDSPMFVTMRQSGFAVYARQKLWVYRPSNSKVSVPTETCKVREATESDRISITLLHQRTVPSLLQQVTSPPQPHGFLYHEDSRLMAFVAVTEGRDGIYLRPYIDHRVQANPADILTSVIAQLHHIERRTITVRVRRHEGWMSTSLAASGFQQAAWQAVMVRHIAAGIHSPTFTPLSKKFETGQLPRQTEKKPEVCIKPYAASQIETMNRALWTPIGCRVTYDGMPRMSPQRPLLYTDGGVPA